MNREWRYIIIKVKDLKGMEKHAILHELENLGLKTVNGVVVEPDWPNYEDTWKAISEIEAGNYTPIQLMKDRLWELERQLIHSELRRKTQFDISIEQNRELATLRNELEEAYAKIEALEETLTNSRRTT